MLFTLTGRWIECQIVLNDSLQIFQIRSAVFPRMRYSDLFPYLLGCLVGRRRPLLGGMKLSHRCNLACIHCPFRTRESGSLSFDAAVSSMKTLRAMGVRIVIIEGGEPFLWRDGDLGLETVIGSARELFPCVCVTTNGTFPIETAADIVWVSLDKMRETHDRIRGDSFDRIISNIDDSTHQRIFANITINSLNHREVPDLVLFLAPRVSGVTIQFHYPYEGLSDDLGLGIESRRQVLDDLIALKRKGLPVSDSYACLEALKDNNWKCRPWLIASVDPSGVVNHGCYLKGRDRISCERCGFAAHTEISLAFGGVPGAIRAGMAIFGGRSRNPGNYAG